MRLWFDGEWVEVKARDAMASLVTIAGLVALAVALV